MSDVIWTDGERTLTKQQVKDALTYLRADDDQGNEIHVIECLCDALADHLRDTMLAEMEAGL